MQIQNIAVCLRIAPTWALLSFNLTFPAFGQQPTDQIFRANVDWRIVISDPNDDEITPAQLRVLGRTFGSPLRDVHIPHGSQWFAEPVHITPSRDQWTQYVADVATQKIPGLLIRGINKPAFERTYIIPEDALIGLSHVQSLERLELHIAGSTLETEFAAISLMKQVKSINCSGSQLSHKSLSLLGDMPNLEVLDVSHSRLTDEACDAIASFSRLSSLNVSDTRLTGRLLERISPEKIQRLSIGGMKASKAQLLALNRFDQLRVVDLSHTQATDDLIETLSRKQHIKVIRFDNTLVSDASLTRLTERTPWTAVSLSQTAFGGDGLAALGRLSHLRRLNLNECKNVTDAAFKKLKNLLQIVHLDLSRTNISDQSMMLLRGSKVIESIAVSGTLVTDSGIGELAQCDSLRDLDLSETQISNRGISSLKRCVNIEKLYLDNMSFEIGLADALGGRERLREIILSSSSISPRDVERIFKMCPNLQIVSLHGTSADDDVLRACTGLSELRWLDVGECGKITPNGINELAKCRSLEFLSVLATKGTEMRESLDMLISQSGGKLEAN